MRKSIFLLFVSMWLSASAQKTGPVLHDPTDNWPAARSAFGRLALPGVEPEQEVMAWASGHTAFTWQVAATRRSPGGGHLLLHPYRESRRLFPASLKVNLNRQGHIVSYFDNTPEEVHSFPRWQTPDTTSFSARMPAGHWQQLEPVWAVPPITTAPAPAWYGIYETDDHPVYEVVFTDTGIVFIRDIRRFHHMPQDTPITIHHFLPDPLTTAQQQYGGGYQDFDDADIPLLNGQLLTDTVRARWTGSNFVLEGFNMVIRDVSAPNTPVPTGTSPDMRFTRGDDGFEFTHTYYHLAKFWQYLRQLGFSDITSFVMDVDPHGTDEDNSYFVTSSPPRIIMGTGGVDDAEDADVIIHEYGHAIAESVSPGNNSGKERRALDEGFGDYLAASYSRSISPFRWGEIYTWDGHNEFWDGRSANTGKTYPDDVVSNIYDTGEIWSSALMDVWEALGRTITDRLAIQAMYGTAANMTLRDAARLLLQAESQLYGGQYQDELFEILYRRGLLESFETAIVGTDDFLRGNGVPTVVLSNEVLSAVVFVYDLQGRRTGELQLTSPITALPATFFPSSGLYIVQLVADGKLQTAKAITLR